jgi:hypothetical protein
MSVWATVLAASISLFHRISVTFWLGVAAMPGLCSSSSSRRP